MPLTCWGLLGDLDVWRITSVELGQSGSLFTCSREAMPAMPARSIEALLSIR